MQATDDSDERGSRRRVEVTRGVIVIVLAIAVGAFVVTQGLGDDDAESAAGSDVAAVGSEPGSSADADETVGADLADEATDRIGGATAESDPTASTTVDDPPASPEAGTDGEGDRTDTTDPDGDSTTDEVNDGAAGTGAETDGAEDPPVGEVKVLVLNGAGAKGIAARGSAILQEAGYDVLAPRNANFLGPSKIFYTTGYESAAAGVAQAYSVDPTAVVEPFDPANPPINDTHGADIIVVVGEDGLLQV